MLLECNTTEGLAVYQRSNVVPIYTNFMIDHLLATPNDRGECPTCRVINAYNCEGLEAPNGRWFSEGDCDCEERREIVAEVMTALDFPPAAQQSS
jgi:hypothetical protein